MIITLVLIIANIAAASVNPSALSMELDGYMYPPGDSVELSGTGIPNSTLQVTVNSTEGTIINRTIEVCGSGLFNMSFDIESNATLGRYIVRASWESDERILDFMVVKPGCILLANLMDLLEEAKQKAEERFLHVTGDELGDDIQDLMEDAEEAEIEARQLGEDGACGEAASKVIDALNLYGRAYKLTEEHPDEVAKERAEETIQLRASIERALEHIERLNQTVAEMEHNFNLTQVITKLLEAREILLEAKELLEGEDLTDAVLQHAEDLRSEARAILDEVRSLIESVNKQRKREKTSMFLMRTECRLNSLRTLVMNILEENKAPPQSMEAVEGAFEQVKSSLLEAKEMLGQEDLDNAIEKLDEAFDDTNDAIESLDEVEEGLSNKIDAVTRLTDKLEELQTRLNKTRGELTNYIYETVTGLNISEIETLLDRANGKIVDAKKLIGIKGKAEEDFEKADELLDEADEILDNIEELIEHIEEEMEEMEEEIEDEIEDNDNEDDEEEPETDVEDEYKDKDKDKDKDKEEDEAEDMDDEDNDDDDDDEDEDDDKGRPDGIPSRGPENSEC
ncbi:MAG: hypothetical protein ACLFVP_07115 [Candidatus Bathyarchaeia archaeon]